MKILFFHRWVGVHGGGTETHLKELAYRFLRRGHSVDILTREGKELSELEYQMRIWRVSKNWRESPFSYEDVMQVFIHTSIFLLKSFLRILILRLKGIEYDVVSVHFATEAFLMRVIRWLFGWPYIFVLEGYTDLEAKEARYANLQIAISEDEVGKCSQNYGYKPLLIPVGVDMERFNDSIDDTKITEKYTRNSEKLILTVCRLEPRKDIPTLISAAKIISKKDPRVKFVIVGEGISKKGIEKLIKELSLTDKVILVGEVSDEELPQYYRACDLFVLPTLYEGFGIVFLEAMASGIPIISTNVGAIPEVVGDCGILIPPRCPKILAENILEIITNDQLRKELIAKGLERAKKYDWTRLILEYEKAYQSVIAHNKRPLAEFRFHNIK